jgi:hypothetical protein
MRAYKKRLRKIRDKVIHAYNDLGTELKDKELDDKGRAELEKARDDLREGSNKILDVVNRH